MSEHRHTKQATLYRRHVRTALIESLRLMRADDLKVGPQFCTTERQVLEDALEAIQDGGTITYYDW